MMRRDWILPLGLAATAALGALTLPALGHEFQRDDWRGQGYGPMVNGASTAAAPTSTAA
jgi:hypothetical protein